MSNQGNGLMREEQLQTREFNPNEHVIQLKNKQGAQDYLPVQWRLVWFREQCPLGTIDTEEVQVDLDREVEAEAFVWSSEKRRSEKVVKRSKGYARFRAVVTDGKGGRATGTKSENAANFPDFIEKAETGAIGRALAALGYGTQFAPELDEEHRIVDSPVERHPASPNGNGHTPYSERPNLIQNANNATRLAAPRSSDQNTSFAAVHTDGAASNASHEQTAQSVGSEQNSSQESSPITEQQLSSIHKLCSYMGKSEPDNVTAISYLTAKKLIQQLTTEYREYKQSTKAS